MLIQNNISVTARFLVRSLWLGRLFFALHNSMKPQQCALATIEYEMMYALCNETKNVLIFVLHRRQLTQRILLSDADLLVETKHTNTSVFDSSC